MQISSTNEEYYYSLFNNYSSYNTVNSASSVSSSLTSLAIEGLSEEDEESKKIALEKKKAFQETLEKQREEISDSNMQDTIYAQNLQSQSIINSYLNMLQVSETKTTDSSLNNLQTNNKSLQYAYGNSFAEKAYNV